MKIVNVHYEEIRATIAPFDSPERRQQYREGKFPRAELVKDLDKRYRWDLFWAVVPAHTSRKLYEYLNDEHIDTALRKIVPPLEK